MENRRILHLTLKKKWFDLIASGKKTVEYREFKPHWEKRLLGKTFDEVHFRNGYRKDSPFMRVSLLYIHEPMNGEEFTEGRYFAIYLGSVLEINEGE